MSVKFTKPEFDIREKISEIPTMGEAAKSLIQAESRKDQQHLLGISGRRNLIINGNFEIWQRGTSGSVVAGPDYVSADRWKIYVNTSTTITLSRQDFSPGQTEVEGNPRYFGRFDWLGTGATQFFGIEQLVEGCHWGAGDYITVSFYARTQTGEAITLGVNQKFGTSGSSDQAVGNFAVDTSAEWQKFVIEIPVPSIKGKTVNEADDSLSFTWYRNGQTDSYLDLAQVQVEVGKGETPFEHRSYGEELALCQRYCYVIGHPSYVIYLGTGSMYTTTAANLSVPLPVQLRSPSPSFIHVANGTGNWLNVYVGATGTLSNATPLQGDYTQSNLRIYIPGAHSGSSPSAVGAGVWSMVLAGAKLIVNAEL